MKELLNKELKLVLHPTNILFIPLAFMLFIPNYPISRYYVLYLPRRVLHVPVRQGE